MGGAHLDSVPAGPGINDNGSGSSALLEVAEQLAKVRTANKLRFAWWSAEEASLVGSTYYVDQLTDEEIADHEMYLNFDMVGSPNYGLFVLDGDASLPGSVPAPAGSGDIERVFKQYYAERDIPARDAAFTGRSDYQAFINNGIPSGGLSTGSDGIKTPEQVALWGGVAGEQYDQCYHQACDDIDNVNQTALRINADAIAYAMYLFATGKETIGS
jgi:Zn-dependent M28 family amino/carboxypeptidase